MSCSEVNILGKKYQEDCPMEDEDHISNLPDDVISHILSCLPTFDAVATCVLAKQWKYKWTSIFNIIIDRRDMSSRYHRTDIVMENVLLHVHNVRRAILMLAHGYDVSTVASWISTLLEKNVKVLHLHLPMNENLKNSTMPNSILNNNSLRELRLLGKYIIKLATRNYCANIRSLILIDIVIKSEGSINDTLVFTFPALETLEILECKWSKVRCVEIYAPALNRLISKPFNKFDGYTMKIFASSNFERFETAGFGPESFLLHGSSIVSADLVNYSPHCSKAYPRQFKEALDKSALNIGKLLRQFSPTLENLTVSVYSAQAILESRQGFSRPICEKLRRLVLIDPQHHAYKMETLLELLHATPFLKVLVLDVKAWDAYDYDAVESTPSCITSYLEEVELRDLTGKAPQVCLAKFLLETTKVLKRFCYRTYTRKRERNDDIMEQLAKFPRAPTCALIFIPGLNCSYRSRNYFW